ncbi:MAG: hypothetical protein IPJ86_10480 [Bacteroidetes bacterium]|nr:hypothetical protein [Bacteroidota bacterium]
MVDSTESTDPHNQEHLISDYLNNHLDPEERLAFERLLTSDPLLADELKLQKELAEAIRRMEREELKQRIVEINNDYELEFEEYSQMTYAAASAKHYSKQKTAVKPKIRYVYSIAAILTIVLISSVIVYFQIHQKSTSKNSFAEENLQLIQQLITIPFLKALRTQRQ